MAHQRFTQCTYILESNGTKDGYPVITPVLQVAPVAFAVAAGTAGAPAHPRYSSKCQAVRVNKITLLEAFIQLALPELLLLLYGKVRVTGISKYHIIKFQVQIIHYRVECVTLM